MRCGIPLLPCPDRTPGAVKLGSRWMTTREALEEYEAKVGNRRQDIDSPISASITKVGVISSSD